MRNFWLKFLLFLALLMPISDRVSAAAEIRVVGTGDGLEVLRAVAVAYSTENPGTALTVPPSIGSGGAIAAVGSERERIGRVARPLSQSEIQNGLVYHPIIEIPSAFYVHPGVGRLDLTSEQLAAIFSGEINDWKSLNGPDLRTRVVRREEADSTLQVLRSNIPAFRNINFTTRSKLAMTTQEALESIRDNPGAIGFAPYSTETARSLGVVRLDGRWPNEIGYPAIVTVALIYKEGQLDDELRRFIRYFASPRAQALIRAAGARPIAK